MRSTADALASENAAKTFQLTTSQGGRQEHTIFHHGPEVFQLTTSQGGRPDIPEIRTVITNFNSRPRKEVDAFLSWLAELLANHFNSRPRKEVDNVPSGSIPKALISTHDLARRSTLTGNDGCMYDGISTHDLARRSTKNPNEQPQNQRNFNSRPRKEVDPCILFLIKRICHFNSRPRKEVDQ